MPERDMLNILNENTGVNDRVNDTDVLSVLNENTNELNKVNRLSENEIKAREAGSLDYSAGINHTSSSELDFFRKSENKINTLSDGNGGQVNDLGLGSGHVNDDGTVNLTAESYASVDKQSINTSDLYTDILGRSKYSELKRECGLANNDSFTEFYNRTKYIPKGYEMEARLALAEEKRMKLYVEYQEGKMSESDFLYHAYGKDLLKEAGYDLENKLFWYNRYKSGDYSNPLDNDTFLGDLINNARTIFENETFIKDIKNKELSTSLAGLVTGSTLSDDKVYDIFKTQIDALADSFNDDINKVITYYKSGNLSGVFNPFVDVDGDNKYDYYYHLDGKMYAVEGSSGVGKSTVDIEYNNDGTVHAVEVNDGLEGWFGGLLEGFRDFWVGFLDIGAMVWSLGEGFVDVNKGGTYWVDSQQRYEAWKKEWLSTQDRVTFDSEKNAGDWGYEIGKGIGTVAGMIVLTVATWGIGTAVQGAGTAAKAGTAAAKASKIALNYVDDVAGFIGAAVNSYSDDVLRETGKAASKTALNEFKNSLIKELAKNSSKELIKEGAKKAGINLTKMAASHAATTALNIVGKTGKIISGARNGSFGGASEFAVRTVPILFTAVKDFASTYGQLEAQNKSLEYLSKQEGSDVTPLNPTQIFMRSLGVATADLVIGLTLRMQGDYGFSNSKMNPLSGFGKYYNSAVDILTKSSEATQGTLNKFINKMSRRVMADNIADLAENLLTAGTQAAFSNPYAKIGSTESWTSFWRGIGNPQVLISSTWQTLQNVKSFGGWSKSTFDSRMENLINEFQINSKVSKDMLARLSMEISNSKYFSSSDANTNMEIISKVSKHVSDIYKRTADENGKEVTFIDNVVLANSELDRLFTKETDIELIGKVFNISKEEVETLRETIKYLNSNLKEGEAEFGYFSAYLFDKSNKRQTEENINAVNSLLKIAADSETYKANGWKVLASPFSFMKRINTKDNNDAYNLLKNFSKTVFKHKNYNVDVGDFDWKNMFVSTRLALATDTLDDDTYETDIENASKGENPMIKFHFNDANSGSRNIGEFVKQKDGKYLLEYKGNKVDLPFYELYVKAANGDSVAKAELEKHIADGTIFVKRNDNGEIVSMTMDENHPMAGIEFNSSRRNDILQNEFVSNLKFAYEFIEWLCNNPDATGETFIKFDVPLVKKILVKSPTTDNPDAVREIYYFPISEKEYGYETIVNRFHTVSIIAKDYMTVMSGDVTKYSKEDIENIFIRLNLLTDEETSVNNLYLELTKLTDELKNTDKRNKLLEDSIPRVTALILSNMKFFVPKDGSGFTKQEEMNRSHLMSLWTKGVITDKTLEKIASGSQKVGSNTNAVKVAKEFLQYTDALDKIRDVYTSLTTEYLGDKDITSNGLTLTQQDKLRELVIMLNDDNNKVLKETLIKDKRLNRIILDITENPDAYLSFFRGLGKDGRVLTQENISAIMAHVAKGSKEYKSFKKVLVEMFNDKVYTIQNRNYKVGKVVKRLFNDAFKEIGEIKTTGFIRTKQQLNSFLSDPIQYIDSINEEKFFKNLTVDEIKFNKTWLKGLVTNSDGSVNYDFIAKGFFSEVCGKEFETQDDIVEYILETPSDENIILDYLRLSEGKLLGDIDRNKLTIDESTNKISYDGKDIFEIIFKSNVLRGDIAVDAADDTIDNIFENLQTHQKLIYENTKLTSPQDVLEINLVELYPNDLNKIFNLLYQQEEAKIKYTRKGKIDEDNLKRHLINLVTGPRSGNLAYQVRQYKKVITEALLNGNFILRFDLKKSEQLRLAENLLTRLGYNNELFRLKNQENLIPGIVYKNIYTHNIETEINADKLFTEMKKYIEVNPIKSSDAIETSYKYLLKIMFSSIVKFDDETIINIKPDGKNALKLYGTANKNYKSTKLTDGLYQEHTDHKQGLLGGELSKIINYYFNSIALDGEVDEETLQTYNIIKAINELVNYVEGEYSAKGILENISDKPIKIPLQKNKTLSDKIEQFYSGDKRLYLYILDKENSTDTEKVFKVNKKFDKDLYIKHISKEGFDVKNLIPVWSGNISRKTHDFDFNKGTSFETVFTAVHQIKGFETIDDILNMASKKIKILSLDEKEYNNIFFKSEYTVSELKELLSQLKPEQNNNYFVRILKEYITVGEESYKVLTNNLEKNKLSKFANAHVYDIVGSLLDSDEFKSVTKTRTDTSKEIIEKLVNKANELIKSSDWKFDYDQNKVLENFDESVSSIDILKLNVKNADVELTAEDMYNLLSTFDSNTENIVRRLNGDADLIAHNSLLSAIQTCLEIDQDGNLTVPVEYYKQLSKKDRTELLLVLNKIASSNKELKSSIEKLISSLTNKDSLITDLDGDYDSDKLFSGKESKLAYENISVKHPSIEVNTSGYFNSGSLTKHQKETLLNIVANREYLKTKPNIYITSSSLDYDTNRIDPLMRWYKEMINKTTYRTVDKEGSVIINNLETKEGMAEFFDTIVSFASAIKSFDVDSNILKGINQADVDKILFELGMHANLYSNGISFDSEYAGGLILRYNTQNRKYEIVPLVTSSSNRENDLLFEIMKESYKTPDYDKYILLGLSKNSFKYNISGFDGKTELLDLDDEKVILDLYQYAYKKAIENSGHFEDLKSGKMTQEQVICEYYKPHLTYYGLYNNVVKIAKDFGVSDTAIKSALPTIESINVRNPIKLSDAQVENYMAEFIKEIETNFDDSAQFKNFREAIINGVNKHSLSINAQLQLDNFADQLLNSYSKRNVISDLTDRILSKESSDTLAKDISSLSEEDKIVLVKNVLLRRKEGRDLEAILNILNDRTLKDFFSGIKVDDNVDAFDFLKKRFAVYDLEWLYDSNDESVREMYQFAMTIHDPISDTSNYDVAGKNKIVILIKDAILDKGKVLKYSEKETSFSTKIDYVTGKKDLPAGYVVVKDFKEAIEYLKTQVNDIDVMIGYNNKAENSDNSFFSGVDKSSKLYQLIQNSIDARTEIFAKTYSDVKGIQGKTLPLSSRDAFDYFREYGFVSYSKDKNAHDALSDVFDELELILKIYNNKVDTSNIYKQLENELKTLLTDSFDDVVSKVTLKEMNFNDSYDKELVESVSNNKIQRGNTFIKQMLDSYNTIAETQNRYVENKKINRILSSVLSNYNTEIDSKYLNSIGDKSKRNSFQKIFIKLLSIGNSGEFTTESLKAGSGYKFALRKINNALFEFEKDYIKNNPQYTISEISKENLLKQFLSLDKTEIVKYIETVVPSFGEELSRRPITEDDLTIFNNFDRNLLTKYITSSSIGNVDNDSTEEANALSYRLKNSVVDPVLSAMKNTFGDGTFAKSIISDLLKVYGITDESKEILKRYGNAANTLEINSKMSDEVFKNILSLFNDELYSEIAAYQMMHEKVMYGSTDEKGNKVENATIYINRKQWKKMYPDSNYGDEFYTKVWRQPGQIKTVVHVLKVKLVDYGTCYMTRDTAKSYFNGDFDGDFYYIGKPKEEDQLFGKNLWGLNNITADFINKVFENTTWSDTSLKNENLYDVIFKFGEKLFSDREIVNSFKNSILNKQVDSFNETLKNKARQYIEQNKLKLSDPEDAIDLFVKVLGLTKHDPNNIKNELFITSSNFFIRNIPEMDEVFRILDENNRVIRNSHLLATDFDSSVIGQVAKKLSGEYYKGRPSEILFSSTFTLTDESIEYLDGLIQSRMSKQKLTKLKERAIETLKKYKGMVEGQADEIIDKMINNINTFSKEEFKSKDILFLGQVLQNVIQNTESYNKLAASTLKEAIVPAHENLRNKLKLLQDYCIKTNASVKDDFGNIDSLNGYELTITAANILGKLVDMKIVGEQRFSNKDNSGLTNLLKSATIKSNLYESSKYGIKTISNKTRIEQQGNNLGLGELIVGVRTDDKETDSGFVVDVKSYNKKLHDSYLNTTIEYKVNHLTKNQLEQINFEQLIGKELTGKQINKIFKDSGLLSDNRKYIIDGATNGLGEVSSTLNKNSKIVIRSRLTLYEAAQQDVLKMGLANSKNLKGTYGLADKEFADGYDKDLIPSLLVGQNLFKPENFTMYNKVQDTGKVIETKDGAKYKLYKVNDITILNVSDVESVNVSERKFDWVSLIQGARGSDCAYNLGSMSYIINSDGTIEYNPEGIRKLQEISTRVNRPLYQDANGLNIVTLCRLAIELNQIKDSKRLKDILIKIAPKDCARYTINDVLQSLYKYGDLGGNFGLSRENAVRKFLNKEELDSLIKTINDDKDVLSSVMFSEEIEELLGSKVLVSAENAGEPTSRKRDNTAEGKKTIVGKWKSNNDDYIAFKENSRIDTNNSFVPRATILRMLLEESGQYYNRGFIIDCINNGLIDLEELINGNRTNLYNSIIKSQSIEYKGPKIETGINQKSGFIGKEQINLDTTANENLTGVLSNSEFDTATNELNYDLYDRIATANNNRLHSVQKIVMPMLLDGTLEDVYSAENNFSTKTKIVNTRPVAVIDSNNSKLELDTAWDVVEEPTIYEARKKLQETLKSPKFMSIRNKLETLTIDDLNKYGISYLEFIDALDKKSDFALKSDKEYAENLKILVQSNADSVMNDIDNLSIKTDISSEILSKINKDEIDEELIKISFGDNQVEFQNAYLTSSGYKAEGGKHIGLETEQIRLKQISDTMMEKYLGKEFNTIRYVLSKDKAAIAKFNTFMNMEKNIQVYNELVKREKFHKNRLGAKKYNEYLNASLSKITDGGFKTVEEAIKAHKEMLSKGDGLKTLFKYAKAINARLLEAAKQHDKFAICGWFISQSSSSKSMKKHKVEKYINSYNVYHEDLSKVINGDISGDSELKFSSLLTDTEIGYLGSVLKAAKQLAETEAIKTFADYAKRSGFMRNDVVYAKTNTFINENIQEFIDSWNSVSPERFAESEELNKETYNRLVYLCTELKIDNGSLKEYDGPDSFVDLLNFIKEKDENCRKEIKYTSCQQLEKLMRESQYTNKKELEQAAKINKLYESTLAVMMNILCENKGITMDSFLLNLYNNVANSNDIKDFVFVDDRGAKLDFTKNYVPVYQFENPVDGMLRHFKYGLDGDENARKIAIARMMIQGDVYVMRKSVADQLEEKVFTKKLPGYIQEALSVAKNIYSTAVMSAPTMALNAWVNFPIFDAGMALSGNFGSLKYYKTAINSLNKLAFMLDNLSESDIENDEGLRLAIRYLYTTNQNLFNSSSVRGESTGSGINIPVLKQYLKASNFMYNIGNAIPRFALWMSLVKPAEDNSTYKIDRRNTGVAFHLMDGIEKVEGNTNITDIYNRYILKDENGNVVEDRSADVANLDAQAAAIVAEHNGLENNMPYLSRKLSQKFGLMFLSYPMQLVRWGSNRLKSLGYAFTHLTTDNDSRSYLMRQLGSAVASEILLLALQILISQDTQEYLGIWGEEKKEEQSEEEKENALNILRRGGCVKLFDTIIKGEEVTSASHSRNPVSSLFNSYIADFIPAYNEKMNDENGFFLTLIDKIKEKTWGHMNFAVKDVVESIPGNKFLQSTSWAEPGDNFWENYGRKLLAYGMSYTPANNLVDYMKSTSETTDDNFFERLRNGMVYAYTKNFSNLKEYKSEFRNYKKAFSVVYDYKQLIKEPSADGSNLTSDSEKYSAIKEDFQLALKTQSSSASIYALIEKYYQQGVSIGTIRSALRSCSLRYQVNNIPNQYTFLQTLTSSEKETIKSALAYEDANFGFLDDILDDLDYDYNKAKSSSGYTPYSKTISSILRDRYYNTPRVYKNNRYSVPKTYLNFVQNYINNVNYQNRYSNLSNPMETYNQMMRTKNYGTSTDIWGNRYTRYTNSDGDKWTYNVAANKED